MTALAPQATNSRHRRSDEAGMVNMVRKIEQHLFPVSRGLIAGLGALVIVMGWSTIGRADACTNSINSGTVTTCATQFNSTRLDGLLASDPAHGRAQSRLDDAPWIGLNWADAPFAFTPSGSDLTMRTSVSHWGAYADRRLAKKIEDTRTLAPGDLSLPPPSLMGRPDLDLWSTLDVKGLDDGTARAAAGEIGADYKVNRNTVVGLAVGIGDEETVSASEENYMLTTYLGLRPAMPITFDAKAAWGETSDTLADQSFTSTRGLVSAQVRGGWQFNNVEIASVLSIAHAVENLSESAGGETIEKSTITIAPRISRSFKLDDGQKLEPFLTYKREIDIDAAGPGATVDEDESMGSLGAGVGLSKPDSYSLRATTDVEDIGAAETPSVKSRIQLTVPID